MTTQIFWAAGPAATAALLQVYVLDTCTLARQGYCVNFLGIMAIFVAT
jgi:hypothetical protein